MDEPLHPSTLSEILDRTAQLYRSRFLVFLGIASLPTAVLLVCVGIVAVLVLRVEPGAIPSSSSPAAGIIVALVVGCIFLIAVPTVLVATALAMAAMSHAAARAFLGQPIGIQSAYRAIWPRGWRAIGLYVFQIVVIWVVPFAAWTVAVMFSSMLAILGGGPTGGAVFAVAIIVIVTGLVTYAFWISIRVSLAFPAAIVEQVSAWDALRRSAALTKGTKGRILVLLLLGVALNLILTLAITVPLAVLIELLPGANTPQHAQTTGLLMMLAVYGSGFAVQALTRPITGIALILFYYDQRIRQEAFDIEWMMLQAGLVVPPPAPPQLEPPPAFRPEPSEPITIQSESIQAYPSAEIPLPPAQAPAPDPGAIV